MKKICLMALSALLFAMPVIAEEEAAEAASAAYPIDFCVVSGEKLGSMGDPVKYDHEGREIQFCCAHCVSSFEKEPAKYLAVLDEGIVAAQSADYPLDVCVVSGEELGSMGEPYNYIYGNRLVKFCCSGCIDSFNSEPAKYIKKIDDARAESGE
jgi:YHS domain-containing protein